jgi:hypothetical protein
MAAARKARLLPAMLAGQASFTSDGHRLWVQPAQPCLDVGRFREHFQGFGT